MKTRWRLLPFVLALGMAPAAARAALEQVTVGNTRVVVKTVTGTFEGDLRTLELQDDVYHNELIETALESATKLTFLDETTLTLGPEASVVLDRFIFDPDPSKASFVMTATKGVFRFTSGKLPKNAYNIHTPAATIGIRGTVLTLSVVPADAETGRPETVVQVVLEDGEATITTCAGERLVLSRAGDTATLAAAPDDACAAR